MFWQGAFFLFDKYFAIDVVYLFENESKAIHFYNSPFFLEFLLRFG